ncbi:hypothetical protein KAH55_05025, partial [bacterium]|nr:hypothetical protein [bacterium]
GDGEVPFEHQIVLDFTGHLSSLDTTQILMGFLSLQRGILLSIFPGTSRKLIGDFKFLCHAQLHGMIP